MTPEEIESIAYEELLVGAESYMQDWFDEEGEFSVEDGKAIRAKSLELIKKLRKEHI